MQTFLKHEFRLVGIPFKVSENKEKKEAEFFDADIFTAETAEDAEKYLLDTDLHGEKWPQKSTKGTKKLDRINTD